MRKIYFLLFLLTVLRGSLLAQGTRTLHGVIKNAANGQPVSGATISITGSKQTTASNSNGTFSIAVTASDTLIISHMGYAIKKVSAETASFISIALEQSNVMLEEVTINTGYQQLKPNEVNGSYVVIDNKTLNRQTGSNIMDRLLGVTSSLLLNTGKSNKNPQNNTNISIRGLSTINGPLDPLIVVDNFIYEGDINNINPNDVESVTLLKDAAAASIWGARAGNGVIVVTTRKGKFNQKLQVDFTTAIRITEKPDLYYRPQISSADYIDFEQSLFNKGYYKSQLTSKSYPALSPAVMIFQERANGKMTAEDSAQKINALKAMDSRNQFMKYYYREGVSQEHSINLRGGGQNIAWLISGAYDKSVYNLRAEYNKINLRFENTYRPLKNLNVNAGVYYTGSQSQAGLADYRSVITINGKTQVPYLPLASAEGAAVAVPAYYNLNYLDTLGAGKLMNWNYFPLEDYKHSAAKTKTEGVLAHVSLHYTVKKGITVNFLYQSEKQRRETNIASDTGGYYARNLINSYSQLNRTTGVVTYIIPMGGILNKSFDDKSSYNLRGQVNAERKLGDHEIHAIVGMEIRDARTSGSSALYYGYNPDPLTYAANLDYNTRYAHFITGSKSTIPSGASLTATNNRFISEFANASYQYKGRYALSGSLRRDGSNIFGANTNDKWKPLWSAGLGWVLSKEPLYRLGWLPYLRFSITYGVSGNVDLSKSAVPVAQLSTNSVTNLPVEQIIALNNPELSWERAAQTNYRLDFSIVNNFLNGSIEYYRKRGSQLYGPTPYDYTTWGLSPTITANVADMRGEGIDLMVHSNNVARRLKWTTDFLLSYNTSKTTAYYSSTATSVSILIGNSGSTIVPIIGKPLYAIAAYKWGGLDDQGNPIGYINGALSKDYLLIAQSSIDKGMEGGSFKYIGPANPISFGSLLNEFSYKGFGLSFNITYKLGYYLFRPSLSYSSLANYGTTGAEYKNRWQHPGDESKTNVPSFVYPINNSRDAFYNASEINVIKGDHIRLQFLNLFYSVLEQKKKLAFNSLQLYLNAANLGILWRSNKDRIDPDFANGVPNPKIYTIGFRANF